MLWTDFPCLAWHRIGMDPRSTQPLGTISVPLGPWHFSISLPITSCGLLLFGKFAKKKGEKNIVPLRHEIDRQARCEGHEESLFTFWRTPPRGLGRPRCGACRSLAMLFLGEDNDPPYRCVPSWHVGSHRIVRSFRDRNRDPV